MVEIEDILNEQWEFKLQKLREFLKKNPAGWPSRLSKNLSERSLRKWCQRQQSDFKKGRLHIQRIQELKGIDFPLDITIPWYKNFNKIKIVLVKKEKIPRFSSKSRFWLKEQKANWSRLSPAQKKMLESIDFFEIEKYKYPVDKIWELKLEKIIRFLNKHKRLPLRKDEQTLHRWLETQRHNHKKQKLPLEKLQQLSKAGIDIMNRNSRNSKWEQRFSKIKAFIHKNGKWPRYDIAKEFPMYRWCIDQRKKARQSRLTNSQIQKLTSIGFSFLGAV